MPPHESVGIQSYDSLIRFAMERENPIKITIPETTGESSDKLF